MKDEYVYSVILWKDDYDAECGSLITVEFKESKLCMIRVDWGASDYYGLPSNSDVESYLFFDKENTDKLMLRTGTHNGIELLKAVYSRFHRYKDDAESKFTDFCDAKGIEYFHDVYF